MTQFPPAVEPVPKKKRHRFLKFLGIAAGVIIVIAVIASLSGDDEPGASTDGGSNENDSSESTAGIGDEALDGDFTFVVSAVEDGPASIGPEGFAVTPQGKFVLVSLTVTNHGDGPGLFFGDDQYLIDTEGRKASADSEAAIYLDEAQTFIEEINPGNTLTGVVVFDIAADAIPASLELHDSAFSGGVTVTLQ